jgi:hypothetical protein
LIRHSCGIEASMRAFLSAAVFSHAIMRDMIYLPVEQRLLGWRLEMKLMGTRKEQRRGSTRKM